jgi:predicted MFS family arabinose efflux permease
MSSCQKRNGIVDFPRLPWARFSLSLIFLIHGLIVATWASRIPDFQARLQLSPAILGRSLMMAAIGSVVAMTVAGRLIRVFGSMRLVIATSLGFCLALPLLAESSTVVTLSMALLYFGFMAGSMDVAMNTHAVLLERQFRRHIMSSFHALFSLGGMAGSALGGLVASFQVTSAMHFWLSGITLAVMSLVAFKWIRLPMLDSESAQAAARGAVRWSVTLGSLALLAFSIMLIEGALADWSAIYLRSSRHTGPGFAALGYGAFSAAMALGRVTGDHMTARLGRFHLVSYGALVSAAGLSIALLFTDARFALLGFALTGAGLATIIPNTFAAGGNIKDSAPGASLAVITGVGYLGFLAGPPLIGVAAQRSSLHDALWILVILSASSAVGAWWLMRGSKASQSSEEG